MKSMLVFLALVGLVYAESSDGVCYNSIFDACDSSRPKGKGELTECNAKYGSIAHVEPFLQKYANTHVTRSFDFLLMSSYFGNFQNNRVGFEQLFRKLSDAAWNDAIDLIKYISKRGGKMKVAPLTSSFATVELNELDSMGRALDIQKTIAVEAHTIHKEVTRQMTDHHDPEVGSFLENHFVHKQAQTIRDLSGHTNDLKHLMSNKDASDKDISLALFLFDEYLQKV